MARSPIEKTGGPGPGEILVGNPGAAREVGGPQNAGRTQARRRGDESASTAGGGLDRLKESATARFDDDARTIAALRAERDTGRSDLADERAKTAEAAGKARQLTRDLSNAYDESTALRRALEVATKALEEIERECLKTGTHEGDYVVKAAVAPVAARALATVRGMAGEKGWAT